ncbi:MAG: glycerol-3-phosphate dehydrogenase (NAD(P)+) [Sphingobacteriales bacterium]|jgi:glycerol-3-phosphate dehydrogenase (NAD(P)+)
MDSKKIAVLGGGSWATALVKILLDNKIDIRWWMRNEDSVNHIKSYHHNPRYLSSVELHINSTQVTSNLLDAVNECEIILLATPSAFLKDVLEQIGHEALKGKTYISAVKGVIPGKNQIIGEFLNDDWGMSFDNFAVATGPTHAEEIALEKLSYLTVASQNSALTKELTPYFSNRYVKVIPSDDIYGTEYAAVLKNIFAVASGICHGLNYGDNFQAVLISNSIREMKSFVDSVHPIDRDIKESAYLGDLLVTAYSQFSRNRTFGNMIGKGYSVKFAQMEMNMVAEGYYGAKTLHEVNKKYNVNLPICDAVYNILYNKKVPYLEMRKLAEVLN